MNRRTRHEGKAAIGAALACGAKQGRQIFAVERSFQHQGW